ncbi:MAG: 1-acyl-sn-glycerol-3-phosphate acyltransferase [Leptospiraceae bacterium]|nr:1-acyl-sn-glycerol-3-phosphate acyltransferase [Leptospiraceae bacterium]
MRIPVLGRLFGKKKEGYSYRVYRSIHSKRRKAGIFYFPFRWLFRTAAKIQHAEIDVIGLENIPPDGSVLLVGNHPNSFLDYFNLLTVVRHPIATAAKDTLTKVPVFGPLMRDHALFIPIARKQDQALTKVSEEERKQANDQSIQLLVDHLVDGRLFNIYAEGRSTDSRKLNKIKLGFMFAVIQAEKQFNFRLNLKIVPYGYYYDRINKFQSSVCLIFGKPFRIRDLVDLPPDYMELSESKRNDLEKRIMVEGKRKLEAEINDLIISINDLSLIDIIDEATALLILTPVKYMNSFGNIKEKYRLSKNLSDGFQRAAKTDDGRKRLDTLKDTVRAYRKKLKDAGLRDAVVRRERSKSAMGFGILSILQGLLFMPLIIPGYLTSFLPRRMAGLMRKYVIDIKKKPRVDGDEQAVLGAFFTSIFNYPALAGLTYWALGRFAWPPLQSWAAQWPEQTFPAGTIAYVLGNHPGLAAGGVAVFVFFFLIWLWGFAIRRGRRLRTGLRWFGDMMVSVLRERKLEPFREMRYQIIDEIDGILEDY